MGSHWQGLPPREPRQILLSPLPRRVQRTQSGRCCEFPRVSLIVTLNGPTLVAQADTVQHLIECSTSLQAVRRTAQACGALRVLHGCVVASGADVLPLLDTDFVARAATVVATVPAVVPTPSAAVGSFQEVAQAVQQAGTGRVAALLSVHPEYLNNRGEVRGRCTTQRSATHARTHIHKHAPHTRASAI